MKKYCIALVICILAAALTACVPLEQVQVSEPTPSPIPIATPSPTLARTPSPTMPTPMPTPTYDPEPGNLPMFTDYLPPGEDTVIIADSGGMIIGGYSDGDWLSHSQAAAYCGQTMTFIMKSLDGYEKAVESIGVISTFEFGGQDVASGTVTMEEDVTDYNDFMYLDARLPEYDPSHADCVLYYCPPERFPQITLLGDVSPFLPAVQNIFDEEFGVGVVPAQINGAYTADIDNDGAAETIINSYNNETYDEDGDYTDGHWYSIALIVEDSGAVCEIERRCGYGYWEDIDFACVRGIVDINGDGISEVIRERRGYEWWLMDAYQYDGENLSWAFGLNFGS